MKDMPHKTYSEMQAQWQANWNFAEVFSGELEFKTIQVDSGDSVYAQMPVDTTSTSENAVKWFLINHRDTGTGKGIIIMWCHYGAEDRNNYYIWARALAERTGKAVLIPDRSCLNDKETVKRCMALFCETLRNGSFAGIDRNAHLDFFTSGDAVEDVMGFMVEDSGNSVGKSKLFILGRAGEINIRIPEVLKGRMFVIYQDHFAGREPFLSKRNNPVKGYSSLSLNADFDFTGTNIFPYSVDDTGVMVDKQFDKVFTMASWFLNGIN